MCCGRYAWAILIASFLVLSAVCEEDFYGLLGVSKDADNRAIRRAFKKIALLKHPDKNPDNENAHSEFVRLNRAYEVLMDEELRKKYDQFGEEGLKDDFHGGAQYQSWTFYRDNFGIYDDDPEIVTLSRADFQQAVIDSGETWFVNFYSTFCSHCHQLAPTWRKFAREMEGILRIGAVNCAEDPMLCQSQNVMAYPSLVMYPERLFFNGRREMDDLMEFAMSRVSSEVHHLKKSNLDALTKEWDQYAVHPWVVDFCDDHDNCLSQPSRRKLASMLNGIANVATVNCFEGVTKDELCKVLKRDQGVVFYPAKKVNAKEGKEIPTLDPKEISSAVLQFLPGLESLSSGEKERIIQSTIGSKVESELQEGILVLFVADTSAADNLDAEFKKLTAKVGGSMKVRIGVCSEMDGLCDGLFLTEFPKWVMFKPTGGYEINYSKKNTVHDLMLFARESILSPMITLTPGAYRQAIASGKDWLIDYFAPWCPPCMKLLHELRKLHNFVDDMNIGTVDCVQHAAICQEAAIGSYPASMVYINGKPHASLGFHEVNFLVEFIEDVRNPSVKELSKTEFDLLIGQRPEGVTWVIDYFAPWCGPCQQLAPEFRKLAREVRRTASNVFFGSVDCDAYRDFCVGSAVNAYPTIRVFPADPRQPPFDYPNNWWRDHGSMHRWLNDFLPSKVSKIGNDFHMRVLDDKQPWLIDFFAPWCGHCVQFAPVFESIAELLDGRVSLAKVNCDQWPGVCQSVGIRSYPTVRLYTGAQDGLRQAVTGFQVQSQHAETIVRIVEDELSRVRRLYKTEL